MIRENPNQYDPIFMEGERQILFLYREHKKAGEATNSFSRKYKDCLTKLISKFELVETFTHFLKFADLTIEKATEADITKCISVLMNTINDLPETIER